MEGADSYEVIRGGRTSSIIPQLQQFSSVTAAISQSRPARHHQAACLPSFANDNNNNDNNNSVTQLLKFSYRLKNTWKLRVFRPDQWPHPPVGGSTLWSRLVFLTPSKHMQGPFDCMKRWMVYRRRPQHAFYHFANRGRHKWLQKAWKMMERSSEFIPLHTGCNFFVGLNCKYKEKNKQTVRFVWFGQILSENVHEVQGMTKDHSPTVVGAFTLQSRLSFGTTHTSKSGILPFQSGHGSSRRRRLWKPTCGLQNVANQQEGSNKATALTLRL